MNKAPDQLPSGALPALRIVEFHRTVRVAIRGAFTLGSFYFIYQAVAVLAGHVTTVQIQAALTILADLRFAFAVSLAAGGGVWAMVERRIRQNTVERLHSRIKFLETSLDPARSSSRLTSKGRTNPKDKSV